jgi:hypothetical protein
LRRRKLDEQVGYCKAGKERGRHSNSTNIDLSIETFVRLWHSLRDRATGVYDDGHICG